jgi:hypothetical protein
MYFSISTVVYTVIAYLVYALKIKKRKNARKDKSVNNKSILTSESAVERNQSRSDHDSKAKISKDETQEPSTPCLKHIIYHLMKTLKSGRYCILLEINPFSETIDGTGLF